MQYIITCSRNSVGYEIAKVIIAALYKQNRLRSSRIWISGLLSDQNESYGYSYCEASSVGIVIPDMKDVPFYEVVLEKRSDNTYLVTGNIRHFPKEPFVVTPREFLDILNAK